MLRRSGRPLLSQLLCGQLVSMAASCAADSLANADMIQPRCSGSPAQSSSLTGCLALTAAALHFVCGGSALDTLLQPSAQTQLHSVADSTSWQAVTQLVEQFADHTAQHSPGSLDQTPVSAAAVSSLGTAACEAMHALVQLQALLHSTTSRGANAGLPAAHQCIAAGHSLMVSPVACHTE